MLRFDSFVSKSIGVCDGEAVVRRWGERNKVQRIAAGERVLEREFQRGESRITPAHARGRSPDPLAVGQPFRHRAPGLRSRQPHHGTCRSLVKKQIANLYTKPRIPTVSFQGHATSAFVFQKRTRFRAIPWNCLPSSAQGRAGKGGVWESTALLSMSEPPCGGLSWLPGGVDALEDPTEQAFRRKGETRIVSSVRSTWSKA